MAQPLDVLVVNNFLPGINVNADSSLIADNVLRYAVNCYNDPAYSKDGVLTARNGVYNYFGKIDVSIAAVDAEDEICGMFGYANDRFIVAVDTIGGSVYTYVFDDANDTWNDVGTVPYAWTSGRIMRFERMVDYLFAVDGVDFKSWNLSLTTNWGTTNLTTWFAGSPPTGMEVIKAYQGRLYVAQTGTNRLHFSNLPASGLLSWDTTTNYLDIGPGGVDGITALETNSDLLLIFKTKTMFTWDGNSTQSTPLYNVGAITQETVQTIEGSTLFVHQNQGFLSVYEYTGAAPVDISEPVRDFLRNKNLIQADNIPGEFGSWKVGKNYFLSIGDVTFKDAKETLTFYNVILCYSVESKAWTVMSVLKKPGTYNNFFKYSCQHTQLTTNTPTIFSETTTGYSKKVTVIGGTSLGTLTTAKTSISPVAWEPSTQKGDNVGESANNPIPIFIQTKEMDWGARSQQKTLNKFAAFVSGNWGEVSLEMRVDGGEWQSLGGFTGHRTDFAPGVKGYYFEFRISGAVIGEPFVFEKFVFFDVQLEDNVT